MVLAGIDVNIFKPHSTRSASTSAAAQAEQPPHEILKVAGWKSDCTFAKYIRPLLSEVQTMLTNFYRVSLKIGLRKV